MDRTQRHQVRDAIDRALRELQAIPFTPPLEVERMLGDAEQALKLIKRHIVDVYG